MVYPLYPTIAQLSALSAARARLRSGFGLHARSRCHANTTTPNNTQSDQLYHDRCAVRMTHRTRRNSARRGTGNATHQFRRPIHSILCRHMGHGSICNRKWAQNENMSKQIWEERHIVSCADVRPLRRARGVYVEYFYLVTQSVM